MDRQTDRELENQFGLVVKTPGLKAGDREFKPRFSYKLGDFEPITLCQPNPPQKVVVEKTEGRNCAEYICHLELYIKIIKLGYK